MPRSSFRIQMNSLPNENYRDILPLFMNFVRSKVPHFSPHHQTLGTKAPDKHCDTAREACKNESLFFLSGGFQFTANDRHWN